MRRTKQDVYLPKNSIKFKGHFHERFWVSLMMERIEVVIVLPIIMISKVRCCIKNIEPDPRITSFNGYI